MRLLDEPYTPAKKIDYHLLSWQQCGIRKNGVCEDALYVQEENNILFIGVADGQSGKSRSLEGGQLCLQTTKDFISRQTIEGLIHIPYPDELPYTLIHLLRETICRKAIQENQAPEEYASTLIFFAIDLFSGNFVLFHLGDGCALGLKQDGSIFLISPPENGIISKSTWLSTSQGAAKHLRFSYGSLSKFCRLILLSDGAENLCRGSNLHPYARTLLQKGTQKEISDYMCSWQYSDDASCIIFDLADSENPPTQIASNRNSG